MTSFLNPADGRASRLIAMNYKLSSLSKPTVRKEVKWIVKELVNKGIPVGVLTFSSAMHVMGSGRVAADAAGELFAMMKQCAVKPDVTCYDTLLSKYVVDEQRFRILLEKKRAESHPTTTLELQATLRMLFHKKETTACSVTQDVRACMDDAQSKGLILDVFHFTIAVKTSDNVEEIEEWLAIASTHSVVSTAVWLIFSCTQVAGTVPWLHVRGSTVKRC
eukprot:TRINITY_DN8689_c0_g1_i1.p1 TRINITY_DN8689_c0_g1~~TRINITY_DN8689_c0_g1_i1.p1  ORF type:complete len:220 (+),score=18.33 TRINITY_DN8689_c0_g1_i1:34-693(+)